MMHDFDLICIGGGSAGLATVLRAASYGARCAIVESSDIGGTCVHLGCVPKKIMWHASQLQRSLHNSKLHGIETAKVDFVWSTLCHRRDNYIKNAQTNYESQLKAANITVIHGTARFTDPHTITIINKSYSATHIVIATGSHPEIPDVPGASFGITSDQFFHLSQQPQRVAIVGAGYIAVELAAILAGLGSQVTIITRHDAILRNFDPMISTVLLQGLLNCGVRHIPNRNVRSLLKNADGTSMLHLKDEGKLSNLDCLIWAIGRKPKIRGLHLNTIALATDVDGHVIVDQFQNTNIPNIHAIGDVTGKYPLTPVAIAAGRRLADRLFGQQADAHLSYENIPSAIFSHPPAATVGLTEPEAIAKFGRDSIKIHQTVFRAMIDAFNDQAIKTHMKLITEGPRETVVGIHLVGPAADEIIQGFTVAMNMQVTKADFLRTIPVHPSSAEELITIK